MRNKGNKRMMEIPKNFSKGPWKMELKLSLCAKTFENHALYS